MFKKLTMARILVILHVVFVALTVIGLFVAYVNNSLPHAWQPSVAAGLTIVGALAGGTTVVIKYLSGAQAIDQQQHEQTLARIKNEPILANKTAGASGQVAGSQVGGSVAASAAGSASTFSVSGQPDTGGAQSPDQVTNDEPEPTAEDLAVEENLDPAKWLSNRPDTAQEGSA